MSYSSLWVMDNSYHGFEVNTYGNSWLFTTIAWDVLLEKYMHDEIQTPYGYKKSIIGGGTEIHNQLNNIMNSGPDLSDQLVWELTQQQIFDTRDCDKVARAIREFLFNNTKDSNIHADRGLVLEEAHIRTRFNEIADDIESLDWRETPFFIFKNTSVDDNVEYWFEKYSEEDNREPAPLSALEESVTEFITITPKGTVKFENNLDYFKRVKTEQPFTRLDGSWEL